MGTREERVARDRDVWCARMRHAAQSVRDQVFPPVLVWEKHSNTTLDPVLPQRVTTAHLQQTQIAADIIILVYREYLPSELRGAKTIKDRLQQMRHYMCDVRVVLTDLWGTSEPTLVFHLGWRQNRGRERDASGMMATHMGGKPSH
eukprot:3195145-Amphidinium_carterae.1